MTKNPFDQFSKQLFAEFLSSLGEVRINYEIPGVSGVFANLSMAITLTAALTQSLFTKPPYSSNFRVTLKTGEV
jgi:hypothetical protein